MLDTSVCIELSEGNPDVAAALRSFKTRDLGVSTIAVMELEQGHQLGQHKKLNRARIDAFLANIRVVDFDRRAAQQAARVFAGYERRGRRPPFFDALIAAHALSLGVRVAYHDGDFHALPEKSRLFIAKGSAQLR